MEIDFLKPCRVEEVAAIEKEAMEAPWSENMLLCELDNANSCLLAGTVDDKLVCYGGFRQVDDEAEILNVAVIAELRGRGYGKKIMSALLAEAQKRGVKEISLEVRSDNAPAIALYEKFGFERVGVRKRYYNNRLDALIMKRRLEEGLDKYRL